MSKRIIVFIIAAVLCVSLTSCSNHMLFAPADSLLSPPLYNSQYEGLVEAFNTHTGSGANYSNPTGGDNLSAINVEDLDGDGKEEAVILYIDRNEDTVVHVSVYDYFSDKWNFCADFAGYGDKADSIMFEDFNKDGFVEIMVSWSYSGINNAGAVSVYSTKSMRMTYEEVFTTACDVSTAVDMDGDGLKEILFVSSDNDGNTITRDAALIKMGETEFEVMGTTPVDPNVTGYVSCKAEKAGEKSPMKIYLDAPKSGGMMITEVLFWDSEMNMLTAPLYDAETGTNTLSLRYELINCADINNDGQIEIPVQKPYENNDNSGTVKFYITDWVYFDVSKPVFYVRTFVNVKDGYFINLASLGSSDLYVRELGTSNWNSWIVCKKTSKSIGGDVLFTVVSVPAGKYDKEKYSSYITIMQTSDVVVNVSVNRDDLDEETIRKAVMKLPL